MGRIREKMNCEWHQEQQDYMKKKCSGKIIRTSVDPIKGEPIYCCEAHVKYLPEMNKVWYLTHFLSGSVVVSSGFKSQPILRIQAQNQCNKLQLGSDVCDYLNGDNSKRSSFSDMLRTHEEFIDHLDGRSILASGPYIDRNPPHLHWVDDNSIEGKNKRARLIDYLLKQRD